MKDIVNPHVAEALQRLERAIAKLDSASAARLPQDDTAALTQELARLKRDHGALRETATRVAQRLDTAIGRLQSAVTD